MTAIAMSITRSSVRKRDYQAPKRNPALVKLLQSPDRRGTAKDIGITAAYALVLEAQSLIRRCDTEHSGKPGRPPVIWTLTDKGRKRAQRAIKD